MKIKPKLLTKKCFEIKIEANLIFKQNLGKVSKDSKIIEGFEFRISENTQPSANASLFTICHHVLFFFFI